MVQDALARLVEDSTGLSGSPDVAALLGDDATAVRTVGDRRDVRLPKRAIPIHELKVRVRELIAELARRADASLPDTLAQAHCAWDQVDALRLIDKAVTDEARTLHRHAAKLQTEDDASSRALGLEAQLTLDAALGLVSLLETRLATLVRLRLRDVTPEQSDHEPDPASLAQRLLPDGRPFLDLAAALHETARRWA